MGAKAYYNSVRRALLLGLLLIAGNVLGVDASDETKEDVTALIFRVFGNTPPSPKSREVRNLSPSQREAIRQELYRRLEDRSQWRDDQPNDWYIEVLIMMDDDWARGLFAARFRDRPDNAFLQYRFYKDPKLIALVGDMIFLEDQITEEMREEGLAGRQSWTASAILETLADSPAFTADVINWARRLEEAHSHGSLQIMREWWKANEAVLKANDFKAVQPGRSPVEVETAQPVSVPPSVNVEPVPSVPATPTAEATHEIAPTNSEWTFAAIAAGCLVLLGGSLVFWKRRPS